MGKNNFTIENPETKEVHYNPTNKPKLEKTPKLCIQKQQRRHQNIQKQRGGSATHEVLGDASHKWW